MKIRYLLLSLCSVIITLTAKLFAKQIAKKVDANGDLPERLSRFFQPPDTKCWGDELFWQREMPATPDNVNTIWYDRSVGWLTRNAGQGFDLHVAGADESVLNPAAQVTIEGDITITGGAVWGDVVQKGKTGYFYVRIGKYWHWRNIKHWPRLGIHTSSEFGWRLQGIAEGKPKDICRQLVFTPIRAIKFH